MTMAIIAAACTRAGCALYSPRKLYKPIEIGYFSASPDR